jgi:hypothetical protein
VTCKAFVTDTLQRINVYLRDMEEVHSIFKGLVEMPLEAFNSDCESSTHRCGLLPALEFTANPWPVAEFAAWCCLVNNLMIWVATRRLHDNGVTILTMPPKRAVLGRLGPAVDFIEHFRARFLSSLRELPMAERILGGDFDIFGRLDNFLGRVRFLEGVCSFRYLSLTVLPAVFGWVRGGVVLFALCCD